MSYAQNCLKMDKIDNLLDAIEHPEHYSDAEIYALLNDPDAKETFEMLGRLKSGIRPIPTPDVDAEWKAFEDSHRTLPGRARSRILDLLSRNVAASIAIAIASLAAVAAVVGVSVHHLSKPETPAPSPEIVEKANAEATLPDSIYAVGGVMVPSDPATVFFEDEPLASIVSEMATYYGYEATFKSDPSKSLRLYFRWNQALPVEDVVERLNNFEQIHITLSDRTIIID